MLSRHIDARTPSGNPERRNQPPTPNHRSSCWKRRRPPERKISLPVTPPAYETADDRPVVTERVLIRQCANGSMGIRAAYKRARCWTGSWQKYGADLATPLAANYQFDDEYGGQMASVLYGCQHSLTPLAVERSVRQRLATPNPMKPGGRKLYACHPANKGCKGDDVSFPKTASVPAAHAGSTAVSQAIGSSRRCRCRASKRAGDSAGTAGSRSIGLVGVKQMSESIMWAPH